MIRTRYRSLIVLFCLLSSMVAPPVRASSPVVDVAANTPYLYQYVFTAVTGTVTLTGYYVDFSGTQIGAAVSYSITTATTLTSLAAGGALPSGATGFIGTLSASVYEGLGGLPSGSIAAGQSPASGYPVVPAGTNIIFGRVAPSSIPGSAASGSVTQGTSPWVTTATGNVASGATDSGNPVKVGGVYNTSAPTLTNGQRGDGQMDSAANFKIYLA